MKIWGKQIECIYESETFTPLEEKKATVAMFVLT